MKKSLFGLGVALIALMMVVGNAMANDPIARNDGNRVTVAQNFVGDFLEGHLFTVEYNYSTKIKIINTSPNVAVIGKLVFRSGICSVEVLDFDVYLTPTDAFEATVTYNPETGVAHIESFDDSVIAANTFDWDDNAPCVPLDLVWANEDLDGDGNADGFSQDFYTDTIDAFCPGDTTQRGHFEFYGLKAFRANAPLSKDALALVGQQIAEFPPVVVGDIIRCNGSLLDLPPFAAIDVPNVLAGTITIEDSYYGQRTSLNMVALKNYEAVPINVFAGQAVDKNITSTNSVAEIEAALSKPSFAVPFDFSEDSGDLRNVIITTLPTHYLRVNNAAVVPFESDHAVLAGYMATFAASANADVGLANTYINSGNKYGYLVGLKSTGTAAIAESTGITAYLDFTNNSDFQIDHNGVCGMAYLAYDMQETVLIDYLSGDLFSACLDEVQMQSILDHMRPDLLAAGYAKGWLNVVYPNTFGFGFATHVDATLNWDFFVGYNGTPSINTYMKFDPDGDMSWNFAFSPEDEGVYYWAVDGTRAFHVRQ